MNFTPTSTSFVTTDQTKYRYQYLIRSCFAGVLFTLGFAPFHFPGLANLAITLLFAELKNKSYKQALCSGVMFGISCMAFGVSWIFISIHLYGNLNFIF